MAPSEGLDERFCHSVGLHAVKNRRADLKTHHPGKVLFIIGGAGRAVVVEPLDLQR